jgi:Spy/CpxP family protein refolding chaperone
MSRQRLVATLLLAASFVLGGLVGGAATSFADRRGHGGGHGDRRRPSFIEHLTEELQLTAAERDSVQAVLDRHQPAMDSLWQAIRPQFESERQAIRTEISALLTPAQQARYVTMMQRQDSLRKAEAERRGNGRR